MHKPHRSAAAIVPLVWLLALFLASTTLAANPDQAIPVPATVDLSASADTRTQAGGGADTNSANTNFDGQLLYFTFPEGHDSFVQFDLLLLPADATIDAAELQLTFAGVYTGPNDVELGRVEAAWEETTLTFNTQPTITWGGPVQTVSGIGLVSWDVTALVRQWHSGALPNYGFGLRGHGGEILAAHSKETGVPPTLVVSYHTPPYEGARPDLGDAPDSSNTLGIANTAYVDVAVNGAFPTVWSGTPPNQPAGPRHDNQTGEGILGNYLSREIEADSGPDQDGTNNILDGGTDNANNDRGDDGWRNRSIIFPHCTQQMLTIRVTKASGATLETMYLNVWFDGTRDGDWADDATCIPIGEALPVPASEWLVQDYLVNMAAIAPGGFVDIPVPTETILNTSEGNPHWMRFLLSEERAVQTPGGRADGRGPHPAGALGSYRFGETEDVLQKPPTLVEASTLELHQRQPFDR